MRGLRDKRFIIGGGATGIGAALAWRLAEEGAKVLVGDINAEALQKLAATCAAKGHAIAVQVFDLADAVSIEKLVQRGIDEFGGIDGLATTGADLSKATLGRDNTVLDMDVAIWERTFSVNLIGHALLMRAAIPHLQKNGGGAIVAISSGAAHQGAAEMPAYAASKSALEALVRHVARLEGKHNIRCNGVSPGLVMTDGVKVNLTAAMRDYVQSAVSLPRLGEPDDIASALAFFLSDDSSWISGQVLSVNGGLTFRD